MIVILSEVLFVCLFLFGCLSVCLRFMKFFKKPALQVGQTPPPVPMISMPPTTRSTRTNAINYSLLILKLNLAFIITAQYINKNGFIKKVVRCEFFQRHLGFLVYLRVQVEFSVHLSSSVSMKTIFEVLLSLVTFSIKPWLRSETTTSPGRTLNEFFFSITRNWEYARPSSTL